MKNIFLFIFLFLFSALAFGQAEITGEELYDHIEYLASDELQGRKPGTPGDAAAATYIAAELKAAGLTLLGENGLQYFEVVSQLEPGKGNFLKAGNFSAERQKDYAPLGFSASEKLGANAVFCGYGFATDQWNSYKNVNVKGKWVIVLRGAPENQPGLEAKAPLRDKVQQAKAQGAAGVIFVSGAKFDKRDQLLRIHSRVPVQEKIPVLHVKRSFANKILQKQGKTIEAIETEIQTRKQPVAFETQTNVEAKVDLQIKKVKTHNVVALLEGSDEKLKNEYVVVGGHYDHLGMGGHGSGSRRPDTTAVHNGADDNASGIATIIEIAELLASKKAPKRSILFVAFGAEEMGLLGSKYFVNNPLVDLNNIRFMANFDMVGRLDSAEKSVTISGTGTAEELEALLNKHIKNTGLKGAYSPGGFGASDHSSFYMERIPVLFFNTGVHQDYHTPADDIEKINTKGQKTVSDFATQVICEIANSAKKLTYKEQEQKQSQMANLKVTLGIMPGFGATDVKGLRVDGVRPGGPADNGGMKKGDVIVALDGKTVGDIYEYMKRLKELEPGDNITVDVMREGKRKVLIVQL